MNKISKIVAAGAITVLGFSGAAFADDAIAFPQSRPQIEANADQVLAAAALSTAEPAAQSSYASAVTPAAVYPSNALESGVYADQVLAQASGQHQGLAHNVTGAPSQVN